ncbi:MAG: hypothetical protein IJD38_06245, partial [Clostridia bacterium]|nr:hypothetical protein [Clostridia bacterium]
MTMKATKTCKTMNQYRWLALLLAGVLLLSAMGCHPDNGGTETTPPDVERPEDTPDGSLDGTPEGTVKDTADETSPRHETTDLPYFEESVTLELFKDYTWTTYYTLTEEIRVTGDDTDVIVLLGTTWVAGEQYHADVSIQAMKVGTARIEARVGEQVRVLHVTVVENSDETTPDGNDPNETEPDETQSTEPGEVDVFMEDAAHLEAYEVFEWETPFVPGGDISWTQTDETVASVLGINRLDGGKILQVVLQAWDVTGDTVIEVTCGEYTRVLHLHVEGSQSQPPDKNGSILIAVNDSKETLILGERESRLLIMAELPSDGNLTVECSREDVLSYRYDYHPTVDANGLVASIELFITPIGVGETSIKIHYPEHPDVILEIPFTVEEEEPVYLGEGTLCESISVDKLHAEVYRDDPNVTYTVVTSTDVDRLEFFHLSNDFYLPVGTFSELISLDEEWVIELDSLVVDTAALSAGTVYLPETRTAYSATRKEENGRYVWTVAWDLGHTAVSFVRINAVDEDAGMTDENYVKLNITYPEFDVSRGLQTVINRWVELNLTEPLIFTVDTEKLTEYQKYVFYQLNQPYMLFMDEVEMLMGNPTGRSALREDPLSRLKNLTDREFYDIIFDNNVIYRRTFASGLQQYGMVACMLGNSRYGHSYPQLEGKQILAFDSDQPVFFFHYEIYDETRALIAYENGYEIDRDKFPYAHDILEKGRAVIGEIITEDMTDFEKEKAIYDWMIGNYYKGVKVPPDMGDPMDPDPAWFACVKSAYGILNQYEADCMGWSGAFYLLCNMAGIPCSTFSCNSQIKGGADEGFEMADHRINVVRLDGEYYFVEVFWFYQKLDPSEGDYRFMNMTAERAALEYSW